MTRPPVSLALLGVLQLAACSTGSTSLTPDEAGIWFYYEEPNCDYVDLGPVYAQTVARRWWGWTPVMVEADAANKLRRKAAALGATEIIIHESTRGLPGDTGDLEHQTFGMHRFEGTAIRCIVAEEEDQ